MPNKGLNGNVLGLAVMGEDLYVGGTFTQTADGKLIDLGYVARYDMGEDKWYPLPNEGLNNGVRDFAVHGSDLFISGNFSSTGDGAVSGLGGIVRYDTREGKYYPLPNNGLITSPAYDRVQALALSGDDLFAGGSFNTTGDGTTLTDLGNIARYNIPDDKWYTLENKGVNGQLFDIAVVGDDIFVGGYLTKSGDETVKNMVGIGRYNKNTSSWHALPHNGVDYSVYGLTASGDVVYISGNFTRTNDGALKNLGAIVRYDAKTKTWHKLPNQGLKGDVWTTAVSGDDLYAAGSFNELGDVSLSGLGSIAHLDLKSNTWYPLPRQGFGTITVVYNLISSDRDLFAGGNFTETGDGEISELGNIARCALELKRGYLPLVFKR